MKMVLKYFEPDQDFTWETLDEASHKQEGKWTWGYAVSCWMAERGYEIVTFGTFDPEKFVADPNSYMLEKFGQEKMQANIEHSDIGLAVEDAKRFLANKKIKLKMQIPTLDDIRSLMAEGYIVTVGVNSKILKDAEGFTGHRVVVTDLIEKSIIFNNPGIPPIENQEVDLEKFDRAWGYPTEENKGLTAYRFRS